MNPDECVAQGAAILGSTLAGKALPAMGTGQDLLLLDVIPLSLSIETMGGVATKLVDRNTTLPTRYSKIFTTAAPYQSDVQIHVLQGERPMARDNKTIGKFRLSGIRRAPAGVPQIEVTFDIDANGILKVSAKDLDTGKEQSIVITADDKMSESEIEQAIRDAQQYAGQDSIRRDAMEVSSEAQRLLNETQQMLKENGKQMDKEKKKQIKKDCKNLEKLLVKLRLDKVTEQEVAALRQAKQQLESSRG
jgi:molecular chaperone DnaK